MIDSIIQDLKHGARTLFKSPGFTLIAIASLAIGIGGSAAVFAIADTVLLRSLPGISDPERLVDVGRTQNQQPLDTMSYPNFADLQERSTVFQGLAAYRPIAQPLGAKYLDGIPIKSCQSTRINYTVIAENAPHRWL